MGKRTKVESKCPWYCSETPQKIYCEGLQSNTWLHLSFQSKSECREYKKNRCRGRYDLCPYARLHEEEDMLASKYGNIPVVFDGRRYDSQKEAERAQELKLMQRAGQISELQEQVKFLLVPKQKAPDGKTIQPEYYIADFVYTTKDGEKVVEDVKGHRTDLYKSKKKRMLQVHGIWIKET